MHFRAPLLQPDSHDAASQRVVALTTGTYQKLVGLRVTRSRWRHDRQVWWNARVVIVVTEAAALSWCEVAGRGAPRLSLRRRWWRWRWCSSCATQVSRMFAFVNYDAIITIDSNICIIFITQLLPETVIVACRLNNAAVSLLTTDKLNCSWP